MPAEKKRQIVEDLRKRIAGCTIAIATDYRGLSVPAMTGLRRSLREKGIEYRVVKNTLTYRAAEEASKPGLREVVQGTTGLVFGYGDPVESARALYDYIRASRSSLAIRGAVVDGQVLTADQVVSLAHLPPRDVLAGMLLGQMKAPITGLVFTLKAVLTGLATVLQRHVEQQTGDPAQV